MSGRPVAPGPAPDRPYDAAMAAAPPRPARRPGTAFVLAGAAALPGSSCTSRASIPEPVTAAVTFGLAVVGAAFMLAWAAEAVQVDISAGLALALLALVAVLPEYAVDFVFTWKAGKHPAEFAPDALANMTGGNQLLIGAGWSLVVLVARVPHPPVAARPRAAQRARDPGDPPRSSSRAATASRSRSC